MKGSVKIQLFDKDGNIVNQVEDHNMLTNFIQNYFRGQVSGCGRYQNGYTEFMTKLGNMIHKYFGTLQIFGDTLSEDPADYFANGQKVLGVASYGISYSGSRPWYGNFNGSESGWTDDNTYKYVYDFPTSQSNGTIKAIGLSPITANGHGFGVQGCDSSALSDYAISSKYAQSVLFTDYGDSYFTYPRWNFDSNATDGTFHALVGIPNLNFIAVISDEYKQLIDYWTSTNDKYIGKTSKLVIKKFPWMFNKLGFNKVGTRIGQYGTRQVLDTLVELELKNPLNTNSYNYGFYNYANGKIYALFANSQNWNANVELNMSVYDIESGEQSVIKIKNTTGKTIKLSSSQYNSCNITCLCGHCNGEYLFVRSTENKCYSINITDQSDVKGFKTILGNEWTFSDESFCNFYQHGDCVWMSWNSANIYSYYSTTTTIYCFNLKTGLVCEINTEWCIKTVHDGSGIIVPIIGESDLCLQQIIYSSMGDSIAPFRYKNLAGLCLSTKMNLDEPVVKTADFSMKVTYTIQSEPMG